MKSYSICLQSETQYEVINDVISFVGEDASGSFGILAGHARMMACLKYGLSMFRYVDETIEYLALPGAILYFVNNKLTISTRHYLRSHDYQTITAALDHELRLEEENLQSMKKSLHRLDQEMLKHLWQLKRKYRYEAD